MSYFEGKSAAITGAASGIGRALAVALSQSGCRLHLADIDSAGLEQTRSLLAPGGADTSVRRLDVADQAAVADWAAAIEAGDQSVDIVINNAGVAYSARVDASDYGEMQRLMDINFWGVVHGTRAFLPQLMRATPGHLVNLSSIFGIIGVPTQSAYNAAKFAVRGFTESLRQETAASGLHVCCVHPGGVRTNIARNSRGGSAALSPDERAAHFERFARTSADAAAAQILRAVEKRRPRLLIGRDARVVDRLARVFPSAYPRFLPGLRRLGEGDL
jgi:NADP-dependent 3-hydroxy acid dehydrogenase YdfG